MSNDSVSWFIQVFGTHFSLQEYQIASYFKVCLLYTVANSLIISTVLTYIYMFESAGKNSVYPNMLSGCFNFLTKANLLRFLIYIYSFHQYSPVCAQLLIFSVAHIIFMTHFKLTGFLQPQGACTICLGSRLLFYRKCTRFTVCLTYSHISLTVYINQ